MVGSTEYGQKLIKGIFDGKKENKPTKKDAEKLVEIIISNAVNLRDLIQKMEE